MTSLRIVLALAMLLQVTQIPCHARDVDNPAKDAGSEARDPASVVDRGVIPPGARIRISAPSIGRCRIVGFLIAQRDEAVLIKPGSSPARLIPLEVVSRLEVSRGKGARSTSALLGGLIGLFGGMYLGAIATNAVVSGEMDDGAGVVAAGALLGGFVGLLSGAVAGAVMGRERWETVQLSRFRLGISPSPRDGMMLRASLRL